MTENHHHETELPLYHEVDDDSPEAVVARMRELFAFERSAVDELVELSKDPSRREQFTALLDDLTYEALADNDEFVANIKIVREHVKSSEEQERVRNRQRALFAEYSQAILRQAGIASEQVENDMDASKARIHSIVEAALGDEEHSQPQEILQALGMLTKNEDGKEVFTYPEGLFPESTDAKWRTYLETVRTHLRVQKAVEARLRAPEELEEADAARRIAHNSVSRDVDELLGFKNLADTKWDFEDTRNMLAKIRDSKFPTVETGEKLRTERRIVEGVIGERAIKALRMRLSDLHK